MLTFDKDGWLFSNPLENKVHDIGILELNDLLHLAYEEDCWSKGVRENVKRRMTDPAIRNSQKIRLGCRRSDDKEYRRNGNNYAFR